MRALQQFELYAKERMGAFKGPRRLLEAIDYSFFTAGKRVRPLLMIGVATLSPQNDHQKIFPAALALEMVHTYSLIHDDLPAMDNDDLRRGILTSHLAFGEATALLAGDALLSQSFEILTELEVPNKQIIVDLIAYFSQVIGEAGMVGGQMQDILLEQTDTQGITLDKLQAIHMLKTGKLLEFALLAPVEIYEYPSEVKTVLRAYTRNLGLLFQAVDDYLDDLDEAQTGKTRGSDEENNKVTYLSFMSRTELKEYIFALETMCTQALATLEGSGYDTEILRTVLQLILRQTKAEGGVA